MDVRFLFATLLSQQEGAETFHYVQLGPYLTEAHAARIAREVEADTGLATLVLVDR